MKISLIVTVKNEQDSILVLLKSIEQQTLKPSEVVIVDGRSSDETVAKIKNYTQKSKLKIRLFQQDSNISQGRNLAIKEAAYDLLAITDAGCRLDPNWLKELAACYQQHASRKLLTVVAGYYDGDPKTQFEQAVVPYVLVMEDNLSSKTFLPATRSMLLPRLVWNEVGGFDSNLQVSEDFAFAHAVVERYGDESIIFCQQAVAHWRPRSNLSSFYSMIRKMARGDIQAGLVRGRVKLLFGRYAGGLLILMAVVKNQSLLGAGLILFLILIYTSWAVAKNKKYVGSAWYWLPVLQYTADLAVMIGSMQGVVFDQQRNWKTAREQ